VTPRPYTLIAELTYRCPLGCVYCSNPVDAARHERPLAADVWKRVLAEAAALGVLHVHFTGGEPLLYRELESLVAEAHDRGLYTNLITSGVSLQRERLEQLERAGLEHLQLSVQGATESSSMRFAHRPAFAQKLRVARWTKELGLALTLNAVLHRQNFDELEAIVALAEELEADRLELANVQYLGWALENRRHLMPTREQIEHARRVVNAARRRLLGTTELSFVLPDYHAGRPRACMDGWANRYIVVSPNGLVLPCHAAHTIAGLSFENVQGGSLATIWERSSGLRAFRGEDWLPATCRGCALHKADFGGCRCQAFHLTGDAHAMDPACELAPSHALVQQARAVDEQNARVVPLRFRKLGHVAS